jgi:hypothetical protein
MINPYRCATLGSLQMSIKFFFKPAIPKVNQKELVAQDIHPLCAFTFISKPLSQVLGSNA